MSAYIETVTPMVNTQVLIEALCQMGFKKEHIEHSTSPVQLFGFEGLQRNQSAHIVIRKHHVGMASNDLGFLETPTGYRMIVSDYDRSRYGTKWLADLVVKYQAIIAEKQRKLAELQQTEVDDLRAAQSAFDQKQREASIAKEQAALEKIKAEQEAIVENRKQAIQTKAEEMGYEVVEKRRGKKVQLVLMRVR